jgi:hypothetical protein
MSHDRKTDHAFLVGRAEDVIERHKRSPSRVSDAELKGARESLEFVLGDTAVRENVQEAAEAALGYLQGIRQ